MNGEKLYCFLMGCFGFLLYAVPIALVLGLLFLLLERFAG